MICFFMESGRKGEIEDKRKRKVEWAGRVGKQRGLRRLKSLWAFYILYYEHYVYKQKNWIPFNQPQKFLEVKRIWQQTEWRNMSVFKYSFQFIHQYLFRYTENMPFSIRSQTLSMLLVILCWWYSHSLIIKNGF